MLPTKAHTLKLFKSVFLQTCPIENISQAPGWPLAGRKRRYRAWYKIFVQIFFQIFFPNFNFIYRKKRGSEKAGLEWVLIMCPLPYSHFFWPTKIHCLNLWESLTFFIQGSPYFWISGNCLTRNQPKDVFKYYKRKWRQHWGNLLEIIWGMAKCQRPVK